MKAKKKVVKKALRVKSSARLRFNRAPIDELDRIASDSVTKESMYIFGDDVESLASIKSLVSSFHSVFENISHKMQDFLIKNDFETELAEWAGRMRIVLKYLDILDRMVKTGHVNTRIVSLLFGYLHACKDGAIQTLAHNGVDFG